MKVKLVKIKNSAETFYVEYNGKLDIWERVGSSKYYHREDLIFITDL